MVSAKVLVLASLLGFVGAAATMVLVREPTSSPVDSSGAIVLPEVFVSAAVQGQSRVITLPAIEVVGHAGPSTSTTSVLVPGS